MAKLLYVKANPKPTESSASLRVADALLEEYRSIHPEDSIEVFDVYKDDFPDFDYEVMRAETKISNNEALSDEEAHLIVRRRAVLKQFMAADRYLFACPVWNLGIPARLKAYFDAVVVLDHTFYYDKEGKLHGLLEPKGKKAVCVQASGNYFDPADPLSADGTVYLKSVLNFMGVWDVSFLTADGTGFISVDESVEIALQKIPGLVDWMS